MSKQNALTQVNDLSSIVTLSELFTWRVAQTPTAEAYRQFDDASGQWISYSWQETYELINGFIQALSVANLDRGSRIAILLPNGLHAVCIDQASLALACVPVPMHALDNPLPIS